SRGVGSRAGARGAVAPGASGAGVAAGVGLRRGGRRDGAELDDGGVEAEADRDAVAGLGRVLGAVAPGLALLVRELAVEVARLGGELLSLRVELAEAVAIEPVLPVLDAARLDLVARADGDGGAADRVAEVERRGQRALVEL